MQFFTVVTILPCYNVVSYHLLRGELIRTVETLQNGKGLQQTKATSFERLETTNIIQ